MVRELWGKIPNLFFFKALTRELQCPAVLRDRANDVIAAPPHFKRKTFQILERLNLSLGKNERVWAEMGESRAWCVVRLWTAKSG